MSARPLIVTLRALDGAPLRHTHHNGRVWYGGESDQRYAIDLKNETGQKLLAVVTIDGLSFADGEPGSHASGGMVVHPYQSATIDGWRKSLKQAAAFRIDAGAESYTAKSEHGDEAHVGVIGVAVFGTKQVVYHAAPTPTWEAQVMRGGAYATKSAGPPMRAPAGTRFGESVESRVSTTTFDRADKPTEVIKIRYDTIKNLIVAGILYPVERNEPNPFPAEPVQSFCKAPRG